MDFLDSFSGFPSQFWHAGAPHGSVIGHSNHSKRLDYGYPEYTCSKFRVPRNEEALFRHMLKGSIGRCQTPVKSENLVLPQWPQNMAEDDRQFRGSASIFSLQCQSLWRGLPSSWQLHVPVAMPRIARGSLPSKLPRQYWAVVNTRGILVHVVETKILRGVLSTYNCRSLLVLDGDPTPVSDRFRQSLPSPLALDPRDIDPMEQIWFGITSYSSIIIAIEQHELTLTGDARRGGGFQWFPLVPSEQTDIRPRSNSCADVPKLFFP